MFSVGLALWSYSFSLFFYRGKFFFLLQLWEVILLGVKHIAPSPFFGFKVSIEKSAVIMMGPLPFYMT